MRVATQEGTRAGEWGGEGEGGGMNCRGESRKIEEVGRGIGGGKSGGKQTAGAGKEKCFAGRQSKWEEDVFFPLTPRSSCGGRAAAAKGPSVSVSP